MANVAQPDGLATRFFDGGQQLPLVVDSVDHKMSLEASFRSSGDWIEQQLSEYGALLFRGFDLPDIADFERVVVATSPKLLNYFEGTSPRTMLGKAVYTSTEYPPDLAISMHNEMSYAHKWPGKIFFYCAKSSETGGETPIANSHQVYQNIAPEVREEFEKKGVEYARNLHGGNGMGLSWQTVFETEDRAFIEQYCEEGSIEYEWKDGGGLRTRQKRSAVLNHPKTGHALWFNQAHIFHPTDLGEEDAEALLAVFSEEELPINACYGDDSAIEPDALSEIRAAYDKAMVYFPWQMGDLLMLDNMKVAHGRASFTGPRKVVVAMAEVVESEAA